MRFPLRLSTHRSAPEAEPDSQLTDLRRVGLEEWLRARGVRPGPVYTVVQVGVVIAAAILAVLLFNLFA
jgi:hypothetical protein